MSSELDSRITILTSAGDQSNGVMNVDVGYTWVQIPCDVDSGSCAHVAPPVIFDAMVPPEKATKGKYFAADGSPVDELGQMTINANLDVGLELQTPLT